MPVRIVDIANKVGVSRGTVDRALHGRGRIDEAMREKILRVAAEMNYRPNTLARSLKTNKSGLIGVLMPSVMNSFFSEIIQGISEASSRANIALVFCLVDDDTPVDKFLSLLLEKRVDGVILSPFTNRNATEFLCEQLVDEDVPVVSITQPVDHPNVTYVMSDNIGGGYTATDHLIKLGHKKIAYVSFSDTDYISAQRYEGYKVAMEEDGASNTLCSITAETMNNVSVERLLCLPDRPTAIFASTDLLAASIIKQLQDSGLRVPEDISVVGFDDLFICTLVTPDITTIRQPKRELGLAAFEQLSKLAGGGTAENLVLDVELVVRKSTASIE